MTEKQQQLLFDKGITNVPSDVLCSDNTLAESVGLVHDNGEHRVIQKPKAYEPNAAIDQYTSAELVIIHRFNDVLRYILRVTGVTQGYSTYSVGDMLYKIKNNNTYEVRNLGVNIPTEVKAETIGNTLLLSSSSGMHYLLWDYAKGQYKNLGTKIPDIQVRFSLSDAGFLGISDATGLPYEHPTQEQADDLDPNTDHIIPGQEGLDELLDSCEVHDDPPVDLYGVGNRWRGDNGHEEGKAGLIGLVASRLNWVKERKRFAFPFWARSAVRLYDGSHINVSNPFLLLPTVSNNWHIFSSVPEKPYQPRVMSTDDMDDFNGGWQHANYMPLCAKLRCNTVIPNGVILDDWADIISGVDIFVSEEVKTFDMEGSWKILNMDSNEQNPNQPVVTTSDTCVSVYGVKKQIIKHIENNMGTWFTYYKPSLLSEGEIVDRLIKKSVFYKIIELDRDEIDDWTVALLDTTTKLDRYTLKNLTTQTQLESDDYFSRSDLVPDIIKTYNGRLHMADAWRGFYDGFDKFSYTSYKTGGSTEKNYCFYVHIKAEDGERVVCSVARSFEIYDVWFYYPDPRAYQVDIYLRLGSDEPYTYNKLSSFSLKEHPYLHGSYYFGHLPTDNETSPSGTTGNPPTIVNAMELLEGQVLVSEVNNPWLFKAEGYVRVGMGHIIGLASQTVALGQEEHGIHPLVVFSERGISTLRLNNEGVYIRSDELSREVCSNRKSITETDGAVFFVSKKGLMVLVGNQVKCVSEQLSGLADSWAAGKVATGFGNYASFFANCFIAYDYRDSLLWLFDGVTRTETVEGQQVSTFGLPHCLIYSIKNGTFTKMKPLDAVVVNDVSTDPIITKVISDYPDYILESGSSLYSLKNRDSINADCSTYTAKMLSRPMKLENALALKSIMEIRNMGYFSTSIGIELEIYASNNLTTWVELTSLRGTPWLYYRFLYTFTNLVATDRFAGTMLVTQERRTNKLRFMPSRYNRNVIDDAVEGQEVRPTPPSPDQPTPPEPPTPPTPPQPTPDPTPPQPTPTEYVYHAYVDPLNIVIPSGSASITQTINVRNTRRAQGGSETPCELYIKLWKRVGQGYTQLAATSMKETQWQFYVNVPEGTDGVVVCVNTDVINTPNDYVDRVEISVNGSEPAPPSPEDLGEFQYRIGAISDPHYNVNSSDQTEYFNDIVNAMEYFAGLDDMKFVTCCGDMCEEKNKDLVMFTRLWANKAKVLNGGTPPASLLDFQLILQGTLPLPSMRLFSCLGNHDVKQVDGQTSNGFNDPSTANKWGSVARLLMSDGTTVTWEDEVTSDHDDGTTNAPDWLNDAGNPTNRDYSIDALREYIGLTDDDVYFCGYDDVWEPTAGWGTYNRLLASSGGWSTRGGRSKTNFYIKIKSDGTHAMPYLDNGEYVDDDNFETLLIFLSADYGTDPNVDECWRFDHPYGVLDTTSGYAKDVEDYVLDNEVLLGNQNLYDPANEGLFNYQFYDCKALLWLESVLRTYSDKRILIFHHHPFPQKAGNGKSVDGTGYYASKNSIRPYHLTGDGKNYVGSGSYQLCGVQFHFLNILNRKYKNAIWFTGHSHFVWEDDQYDPYINFCNKEFDYRIPTASEAATDYNGSSNVPAFYTRTSDTATEETGWNVHLPSLSRPKTLSTGTELKLPYASEGAVIDVYEHGILVRPIIFKENSSGQGGTYVNRLYGDGQIILDETN